MTEPDPRGMVEAGAIADTGPNAIARANTTVSANANCRRENANGVEYFRGVMKVGKQGGAAQPKSIPVSKCFQVLTSEWQFPEFL